MTPALRFLSTAITTASPDDASGSLFIAGVFLNGGKPRLTPSAAEFDEARGGTLTRMIECGAFDAKAGSTLFLGETEAFPNGFAVLGLGEEKDFSRKVFAECAAKAARAFAWGIPGLRRSGMAPPEDERQIFRTSFLHCRPQCAHTPFHAQDGTR